MGYYGNCHRGLQVSSCKAISIQTINCSHIIRSRAKFSKDEQDTEMLKDRWHTAHDVCSLAACNIAFEDCKEEGAYDLGATPPFYRILRVRSMTVTNTEAAWPIIGMCTWVVDFTEKLMKACVLSGTSSTASLVKQDDSSLGMFPIL